MAKIITINGYPNSGKDTFVEFCREIYSPTFNLLTSTLAVEALETLGWNRQTKTPEIRAALSNLMLISESLFDGPFKYIRAEICKIQLIHSNPVIFIHSREPRNIKRYVEGFDAQTLLIKSHRPEDMSNTSDREVYNYEYDFVIENMHGLREFREKAIDFIESLTKEI